MDIHSPTEGYSLFPHFLAIVNNVLMNISVQIFARVLAYNFCGYIQKWNYWVM